MPRQNRSPITQVMESKSWVAGSEFWKPLEFRKNQTWRWAKVL